MKLQYLRISNFQSFGPEVTEIEFNDLTFLIGPNGSGKTALLQALSRLFDYSPECPACPAWGLPHTHRRTAGNGTKRTNLLH